MDVPITPRWRRRKPARPNEIASAAFDLFVERGFAATRLDDVAARAGVSKGTLYLYFDGKEALLEAAINDLVLPNLDRIENLVEAHTGSNRDLLATMLTHLKSVLTGPVGRMPKLMIAEAANFPEVARHMYDKAILRAQLILRQIIERGIAQGEFRPVNPEWAAQFIQSQMVFLALWTHALDPVLHIPIDVDLYLTRFSEFLTAGLCPPAVETGEPSQC